MPAQAHEAVTDPYVSFDGEWVYYAYFHDPEAGEWKAGADIYKIHVKSKKIVRLTHGELTPNTGNGRTRIHSAASTTTASRRRDTRR